MKTPPLTTPEIEGLQEGSLVISVFKTDSRLYRAKVEKILPNGSEKKFKVRFIDYGNSSEVDAEHLFSWEPLLEVVPAQAICCKLKDLQVFVKPIFRGSETAEHFTNLMKKFGALKMSVTEILRGRDKVFHSQKMSTELVVNLECYSNGENVLTGLKANPVLERIIDISNISSTLGHSLYDDAHALSNDRLAIIGGAAAAPGVSVPPPPDHLRDCPLSSDAVAEFPLPVHPDVSFSVDKVSKWLGRTLAGQTEATETRMKKECVFNKDEAKPRSKEPEFSNSAAAKRNLISEAKKVGLSGDSEKAVETSASASKEKTSKKVRSVSKGGIFPSNDIRNVQEIKSLVKPADCEDDESHIVVPVPIKELTEESNNDAGLEGKSPEQIPVTKGKANVGKSTPNKLPSLSNRKFQEIEVG